MTTIDKIRAEIKKRRLHFNKEAEKYQALNNGYSQNCYGARDALRDLENFLHTLEEPVSDCHDLEEAAEEYCKRCNYLNEVRDKQEDGSLYHSLETDTAIDAFKAGAEWQKAKMMEGAVEGEVVKDISNKLAVTAKNINLDGFRFGDKVKIIIVKEDKK